MGQSCPTLRGRGPSYPQFWLFLSIYAYTFYRRTAKLTGNTYMEGAYFRGQTRRTVRGRGPSSTQFFGFLLFIRTPFVAELPNLTW